MLLVLSAFNAHAKVNGCSEIKRIPKTIDIPGNYCLTQNLDLLESSGNAITIEADDVTIDLSGLVLSGVDAGVATLAIGIYANERKNITIRNGTIRGFLRGIHLDGSPPYSTSRGHLVEGIRADKNTQDAMQIAGEASIVRHNRISDTGGSTAANHARGIFLWGAGVRAINNDIDNTFATGSDSAYAILLGETHGAVIERNRINSVSADSGTNILGIHIVNSLDVLVVDNRITDSYFGIFFGGSTGKYMDNLTSSVTVPFSSGISVGINN